MFTKLWEYLADRLEERTTWGSIGAGVMGAASLPWPFNALVVVLCVIGVLVPSPPKPTY